MILPDDVISILNAITGPDPIVAAIAAGLVSLIVITLLQRHIKPRWYRLSMQALPIEFAIAFSTWRFGVPFVPYLCGTIFISNAIAIPVNYLCCKWELDAIVRLCTTSDPDCDYVAAFRKTNSIDPARLTSKQLALHKRDRIFTNVYLGNNAVAKEMLNDSTLEPCFVHFALHTISDSAGDYAKSQLELEKANACKSDKTDPFIAIQLELNQAVLHVDNGQSIAADSEFVKTLERARNEKVKSISFIYLLFENWMFNIIRISDNNEKADAGWKIVRQFEAYLNDFGLDDPVSTFNLKLQLMREIHSSPSEKNRMLQDAIEQTINCRDLSKGEKMISMASLGRIAWSDGLDQKPIFRFFLDSLNCFAELQPGQRFMTWKEISIMLSSFQTYDNSLEALGQAAASYLNSNVQNDLKSWESQLPAEAIKLRAGILHEYAAYFEIADPNRASAYLTEEIKLLENGLLTMAALERKWQLARHLIYSNPKRAKQLLEEVRAKLETLQEQPSLKYPYIETSLCYALLGMPAESIAAYDRANSFTLSLEHYAPQIRLDCLASAYCVRFFRLLKGIARLKQNLDSLETREGREWISDFPYISTFSATILCGRYLGQGDNMLIATRKYECPELADQQFGTSWLFIPEVGLELDPTIRNSASGIVGGIFLAGHHPLAAQNPPQKPSAKQGFIFHPIETLSANEEMLDEATRVAIKDVLRALSRMSNAANPSIEKVRELYRAYVGMQPIPD